VDDALYVELDRKYVGLLFYDHEDAKATYRIDSVTYIDNKKKKGLPPGGFQIVMGDFLILILCLYN
jgi:hypothetical protein